MSVKAKNQITIFTSIDPEEVETRFEQTDEKFSWLVKSGTSATDFELTDRVATLISPEIVIKASAADDAATVISGGTMDIDTIFAQDITATGTITGATLVGSTILGNDLQIRAATDGHIGTALISTTSEAMASGGNTYKCLTIGLNGNESPAVGPYIREHFSLLFNGGEWLLNVANADGKVGLLQAQGDPSVFTMHFDTIVANGNLSVSGTINGCEISGIHKAGGEFVHGGAIADMTNRAQAWSADHSSFIGSIYDGEWYNYISVRHRNGSGDGNLYGMRLWSTLCKFGNLQWQQQVNKSWGAAKVIVDNSNIGTYLPTAAPGTKGGAQMLSGYFTMKAIAAGKYGDKTYEFSSGTFSGTPSGVVCIRNASPGTSVSGNAARSVVLTGTTTTSISVRAYNNSTSSWTPQISYILIYRG